MINLAETRAKLEFCPKCGRRLNSPFVGMRGDETVGYTYSTSLGKEGYDRTYVHIVQRDQGGNFKAVHISLTLLKQIAEGAP